MATSSSILAWRILRTEEPGRLQSMSLKELDMTEHVRARAHTHTHRISPGELNGVLFFLHLMLPLIIC